MPSPMWRRLIRDGMMAFIVDRGFIPVRHYAMWAFTGGRAFTSAVEATLGGGEKLESVLVNPSDSGIALYVMDISVPTTAQMRLYLAADPSISDYGSEAPAMPLSVGGSGVRAAKLYYGGTYSASGPLALIVPGGEKRFATGGLVSIGYGIVVWPGHSLYIAIENITSNTENASIQVSWYEDEPEPMPE